MLPAPDVPGLIAVLRDKVAFFGTAGVKMPDPAALGDALAAGVAMLPRPYAAAYVAPVQSNLANLLTWSQTGHIKPNSLEQVTGAIYQHAPGSPLTAELRRFLAVVSDLYRSFLDSAARNASEIPMAERLPPLAMFQYDGGDGPVTIEVDLIARFIGGDAGVVCLPATYAAHPILWAALAHETGGHDVTHADPGLLDQLVAGLPAALAGHAAAPFSTAQLVQLWGYWMDEAAADVYGLLNIGPAFAENLAVYLAAMNDGPAALRSACSFERDDPDKMLDPHPADVLRLSLALGVIENLGRLAPAARADAAARIGAMVGHLVSGATLQLNGNIALPDGRLQRIAGIARLADMQAAAHAVGAYIATARLAALGGKSIQDIETWDDADEENAQAIAAALVAGTSVLGLGDDGHVLAGANLAALARPAAYDAITALVNEALDHSYRTDPLWGPPDIDHLYLRY